MPERFQLIDGEIFDTLISKELRMPQFVIVSFLNFLWNEYEANAEEIKSYKTDVDLNICPNCGGVADNGFSRTLPPEPYYCTKCQEKLDGEY